MKVSDINWSKRTANCFKNNGLFDSDINVLTRQTPKSLLKMKNFGRTSLREVIGELSDRNMELSNVDNDELLAARIAISYFVEFNDRTLLDNFYLKHIKGTKE